MYTSSGGGATSRTTWLVVLQTFLLMSVLVLTPASAIAQNADASVANAPDATEPAKDAAADTKAAQAAPDVKLRIFPKKVKLFAGGRQTMSGWLCPADIGASFGPDKEPGTADDDCTRVQGRLGRAAGECRAPHQVHRLPDPPHPARRHRSRCDRQGQRHDMPRPPPRAASSPASSRSRSRPRPAEPAEPKTQTKSESAPKKTADDCDVDPLTGECLPAKEPVVDEPVVTEPPADQTTTDQPKKAAAPKCDVDPLTGDCLVKAPAADTKSQPKDSKATKQGAVSLAADVFDTDGAADLDQCANGTSGVGTTCTDWINGNLNGSKARYNEGDVVPYRMLLSKLPTGGEINALTIEWDTTEKTDVHALDYITSYDVTVTGADPCAGVSSCTGGSDAPSPSHPIQRSLGA